MKILFLLEDLVAKYSLEDETDIIDRVVLDQLECINRELSSRCEKDILVELNGMLCTKEANQIFTTTLEVLCHLILLILKGTLVGASRNNKTSFDEIQVYSTLLQLLGILLKASLKHGLNKNKQNISLFSNDIIHCELLDRGVTKQGQTLLNSSIETPEKKYIWFCQVASLLSMLMDVLHTPNTEGRTDKSSCAVSLNFAYRLEESIVSIVKQFLIPEILRLAGNDKGTFSLYLETPHIIRLFNTIIQLLNLPDQTIKHESTKDIFAEALASMGFIRIALEGKGLLRGNLSIQSVQNDTNGTMSYQESALYTIFDILLVELIKNLKIFAPTEYPIIFCKGNIIPHNYSFSCLSDSLEDIIFVLKTDFKSIEEKEILRASIAIIYVSFRFQPDSVIKHNYELHSTLEDFLRQHDNLEFLCGASFVQLMYIYIVTDTPQNSCNFKPYTHSKIFNLLELTLNSKDGYSQVIKNLIITHDDILFPWIWQFSRNSWSLKEFVGNLTLQWIFSLVGNSDVGDLVYEVHKNFHSKLERISDIIFHNDDGTQTFYQICIGLRQLPCYHTFFGICLEILSTASRTIWSLNLPDRYIRSLKLRQFFTWALNWVLERGETDNECMVKINQLLCVMGENIKLGDARIGDVKLNSLISILEYALGVMQNLSVKSDTISSANGILFHESISRLQTIFQFLTIASTITDNTVGRKILQHRFFFTSLRQWVCHTIRFARETAYSFEFMIATMSLRSAALELMSTLLDKHNDTNEVYWNESLFVFLDILNSVLSNIIWTPLLISPLSHYVEVFCRQFYQIDNHILNQAVFRIWVIIENFIVAEIDHEFSWVLLPTIVDCLSRLLINCSQPFANYLANHPASLCMLETLVTCTVTKTTLTDQQQVLLRSSIHLLKLFKQQNANWLSTFFDSTIMKKFIQLNIRFSDVNALIYFSYRKFSFSHQNYSFIIIFFVITFLLDSSPGSFKAINYWRTSITAVSPIVTPLYNRPIAKIRQFSYGNLKY